MTADVVDVALPITPPVAITGLTVLGVSMSDWVYIATIIYTLVGTATIIKNHWFTKDKKDDKDNDEERKT